MCTSGMFINVLKGIIAAVIYNSVDRLCTNCLQTSEKTTYIILSHCLFKYSCLSFE